MAKPTADQPGTKNSILSISTTIAAGINEAIATALDLFYEEQHSSDYIENLFPAEMREYYVDSSDAAKSSTLDAYRLGNLHAFLHGELRALGLNLRVGRINLPSGSRKFLAEVRIGLSDVKHPRFVDVTFEVAPDDDEETDRFLADD
jgi:hypothetical protein